MPIAHILHQILATICCNLLTMSFGGCCGWTSVYSAVLETNTTSLEAGKLTSGEAAWVISMPVFGGFWGNLLFGYVAEHFGRKRPLLFIAVVQILGWLIILVARNVYHLYIGRFLLGLVAGGIYVLIPLFTTEISADRIRGRLSSLIEVACNLGMLFELIASSYVSYSAQAIIFMTFPMIFLVTFAFFPETPIYLIRRKQHKAAKHSISFYHGYDQKSIEALEMSITNEISTVSKLPLESTGKSDVENSKITFSDFWTRPAKKAFIIGFGLMVLNQFSGCFVMLSYSVSIFVESGSSLNPSQSAIVIGVIQCLGSYSSSLLVDKVGRKLLLTFSAIGTCMGLSVFGTYGFLKTLGYGVETFKWIPLASFAFIIFIGDIGILTVHFCVIAETLPEKIKNYGISMSISLMWIFGFVSIRIYPILVELIGMHGNLFIFAIISLFGAIFVQFVLPETKGKSHQEIMKMLER